MIKESGIVTALSWVKDMLSFPVSARKKIRRLTLDGILKFKKGKVSKESQEFVDGLKANGQFIGFATNISYIMENAKYDEELDSIWVHALSQPSLLYKLKGLPVLVVTNPNIEYNDSVLNKIENNKFNKELMKILKNSRGING